MDQISITYCVPCGYERRAIAAATAIKETLGIDVALFKGTGGIFKVEKSGEVITKRTREHFPNTEEIVEAVKATLKA